MLPPPLDELSLRVAAFDGALGDRVADAFARLARAAEALAWARDRLPALLACGSEAEVLHRLVVESGTLTGAPEVWAVRWTGRPGEASVGAIAGHGSRDAPVAIGEAVHAPEAVSRSLVARVLREGRPAWSDDARAEAGMKGAVSIQAAALRSIGCVPLGKHAVLYLADATTPARFDADARARVAALCELAAPFLDRTGPPSPPPSEIPGLVGTSRPMRELAAGIRAFAAMPWPALLLGETGTGKEAVARAIHASSPRRDRAFIAVNCGAIPDELAESLLMGHERGSFTGADRRKEGVVESVGEGTLFLDEVGELSPRVQVKLLRLLQEGTFTRVGGDRELHFTGRIVAATHRPIDVRGGDASIREPFRADLYHRLAACVLRVPPLRDRREDIPALAVHLLQRSLAVLPGTPRLEADADLLRWLQAADWPGNVRELENAVRGGIARALARGSDRLRLADVAPFGAFGVGASPAPPVAPRPAPTPVDGPSLAPTPVEPSLVTAPEQPVDPPRLPDAAATVDLATAVHATQRQQVLAALAACGGNKSRAAGRLGVSRQWLYRLLERWDVA